MIGVAIKGLLGRKLRAVLTGFAIVLGVAMISGAFVLTDTLGKSFDSIFNESYKATDAVISSKAAVGSSTSNDEAPAFAADVLTEVEALPGVRGRAGLDRGPRAARQLGRRRDRKRGRGRRLRHPRIGREREPQPAQARDRPVAPGRRADRRRQVDGRQAALHGRPDGRRLRRGPSREVPDQRHRPLRLRRLDRQDDDHGLRPADGAEPLQQARQARHDPRRRQARRVRHASSSAQITPLLSKTTQVKSASAQAASDSSETQDGLNIIKYALLGFAGIALFVGSFVIANTLAITVAQRMRELATLRTLGASRRQVLGSVILESVSRRPAGLDHRALPGRRDRGRADRAPQGDRRRPPRPQPRVLHENGRRQPRRRDADLAPGEPAAGRARDARRADRRSSRGRGHAGVAVRPLRDADVGGRRRGVGRALLLRRVRERRGDQDRDCSRSSRACF